MALLYFSVFFFCCIYTHKTVIPNSYSDMKTRRHCLLHYIIFYFSTLLSNNCNFLCVFFLMEYICSREIYRGIDVGWLQGSSQEGLGYILKILSRDRCRSKLVGGGSNPSCYATGLLLFFESIDLKLKFF